MIVRQKPKTFRELKPKRRPRPRLEVTSETGTRGCIPLYYIPLPIPLTIKKQSIRMLPASMRLTWLKPLCYKVIGDIRHDIWVKYLSYSVGY